MLIRSLSAVATVVAAATMAVAPAMATEEPAPPPNSGGKPCVDTMRPVSRLGGSLHATLRTGMIRGIAIDQGCGVAGAGKLRSVSVSVSRRVGKRCQHMLPSKSFGKASSCAAHVWLRAQGGKAWTFRVGHKLAAGKYLVSSRAIDSAGNVERHGR